MQRKASVSALAVLLYGFSAFASAQTGDGRPRAHGQHDATPPAAHAHGGHGGHGAIFPGSEDFPTIAYDEKRTPRPVERVAPPALHGDPAQGKQLAYAVEKGRCVACHVLGADAEQPGGVGPNLSTYGKADRGDPYTFQQIWDARAHNPTTVMPPFGTNGMLTRSEVMHLVAYLNTLRRHVDPPARPKPLARNFDVAGEDFTLADIYIEQGERLFRTPGDNGSSCASCHAGKNAQAPDLKGVAATYPKYDADQKHIIGLEQRINLCRTRHQASAPLSTRQHCVQPAHQLPEISQPRPAG